MKNILIAIISLGSISNLSAQIFLETFTDQNGSGQLGDAALNVSEDLNWSIDVTEATINSGDNFGVINDRFYSNDLDGIAVWKTDFIDISSYEEISFSLDIYNSGDLESSDYIDVSYTLDEGTSWYHIKNWANEGNTAHTLIGDTGTDTGWMNGSPAFLTQSNLSGSLFQLELSVYTNGTNDIIEFDNVSVYSEQLVVPEPASTAIIMGFSILFFAIKKRKSKDSI